MRLGLAHLVQLSKRKHLLRLYAQVFPRLYRVRNGWKSDIRRVSPLFGNRGTSCVFVIEDEWHAEHIGRFDSRAEAQAELRRLAELPWDETPNLCPCTSWRTCGRRYHIVEYDTAPTPWRQISDDVLLEVSAARTAWIGESEARNG